MNSSSNDQPATKRGPGRPRGLDAARRGTFIKVRVSATDRTILQQYANAYGLSVSDYLRQRAGLAVSYQAKADVVVRSVTVLDAPTQSQPATRTKKVTAPAPQPAPEPAVEPAPAPPALPEPETISLADLFRR